MFWSGLIYIVNGIISALGSIFIVIYNILPNSLYTTIRNSIPSLSSGGFQYQDFLKYAMFFVDFILIQNITYAFAMFMLGYYAIRTVGKWVKML